MAALTGSEAAVRDLLAVAHLPPGCEVLGPLPVDAPTAGSAGDEVRALLRADRAHGSALAAALQAAQRVRSAHKSAGRVRVQLDPLLLG
jgi:primosomal protein N' (replication factor Y)